MSSKKVIAIFLSLVLLILTLVGSLVYLNVTNWSMEEIDDKTVIPLETRIDSVKEGLKYANERAHLWRKDAILTSIGMSFEGKESIRKRKGIIMYGYYTKNKDRFGYPHVVSWVEIDMKKQAIVRFNAYGGENLEEHALNTKRWNIDIADVFNKVDTMAESKLINKYINPRVAIRAAGHQWEFAIYATPDSMAEDVNIIFDPVTKAVKDVRIRKK